MSCAGQQTSDQCKRNACPLEGGARTVSGQTAPHRQLSEPLPVPGGLDRTWRSGQPSPRQYTRRRRRFRALQRSGGAFGYSPAGCAPHKMTAQSFQYSTDAMYAARSSSTPEPPCSPPSALRMTVMGCMGVSKSSSCASAPPM